jgi:type II secretory pathway component PulF
MKLAYKAYDGVGKAVTGIIEAGDTVQATDLLRGKGLFVAQVKASIPTESKKRPLCRRRSSRSQRLKDVAWFSRQIYVLVPRTPLADALHALERQTRPGPWREVMTGLRTRVEEGASLAAAMEPHGAYFDPIYRNLIAAGESSGQLVPMFDRLAALKQKQLKIRNSVRGALIYPFLLMTVGLTIFVMLLLFVIPRFAGLFQTMDVPLPTSTAILLAVSERALLLVAVLLLTAGAVGPGRLRRRGVIVSGYGALACPTSDDCPQPLDARIVSLLGVLMQARIPVLEALRHVRQSTGNLRYQELIARAEDAVAKGEAMSAAFDEVRLINPSVYEAIRSGEASGEIDRLLLNIAGFLDEENEVIVPLSDEHHRAADPRRDGFAGQADRRLTFTPLFDLAS